MARNFFREGACQYLKKKYGAEIYESCLRINKVIFFGALNRLAVRLTKCPDYTRGNQVVFPGNSKILRSVTILCCSWFLNPPTYDALLKDISAEPGKSKTETYEDKAKKLFVDEPANMKLLIVVDKLLTGFDAPSCTYLYIDKSMQDHGLFQAICRVNRLDSEDKKFGFIVDYKDLFKKLVNEKGTGAIQVYTEELDYD